jgi:hypothetical protein
MAITTFTGEKRVSDIATRVFGDLPAAQLKVAEEALLQANPNLKTLKTVKPGAVLIVPQVPGIKPKRTASAGVHPAADGVTLVLRGLEQYQKHLAEAASGEQQEVKNTLAQLKSADMKRLVGQFQLQSQLAQIDAANKQRDASAAEAGTFAKKTIAEMQKDLQELIARLG